MKWMRDNIKDLKEYKLDNDPYRIKLDANEGENFLLKDLDNADMKFLNNINRYPDSSRQVLKEEIGKYVGVNPENIITGNGSSEIIELLMKTFINKGDKVLSFIPTFSMYSIFTKVYGGEFVGLEGQEFASKNIGPRDDFSLNIDLLIEKAKEINPKLILLCNPNNPTGYLIPSQAIKKLLESVDSFVIVDEAYIEFAEVSMVAELEDYQNLIVLRTFSKALGLAGLRLGYMVADVNIVKMVSKVKAPYSLNALSQAFGLMALKNKTLIHKYVENIKFEREKTFIRLKELGLKTYPSSANFILFYSQVEDLSEKLKSEGILIRDFSGYLDKYYRVTIGNKYENSQFVKSLEVVLKNEKS